MTRNVVWLQMGLIEDNISAFVVVLALIIVLLGVLLPKFRGSPRQQQETETSKQAEKISCPRCGELTSIEEDSCPNCKKDLTSV